MKSDENVYTIQTVLLMMLFSSHSVHAQNGWTTLNPSSLVSINSIKAADQNVAWAAGDSGRVLRTTDAGSTWAPVDGGAFGQATIWNIETINADISIATTTPGATTYLYRTTNGGSSWSQVFSQSGGFIDGIQMCDSVNGFTVGDPVGGTWTVLRTTDAGATWSHITTEPASKPGEVGIYYNSVQVIGRQHIWFCATAPDSNRVYRSTDGGLTWTASVIPTGTISIWFNDTSLGINMGGGVDGDRTTDGGATWSHFTFPGTGNSYTLAGAGKVDFWFGSNGTVYHSVNGALSWNSEYDMVGTTLVLAMHFKTMGNSVIGYAGGTNGRIARYDGIVSDIEEGTARLPIACSLDQNYPNPFNPTTSISYQVPEAGLVTLRVYDVLGREVSTLVDEVRQPGTYTVRFTAEGGSASHLASGVYFYRMRAGSFLETKKLLLVR